MKTSFTKSWFRNHYGHKIERIEHVVPTHIAFATDKRVIIDVYCAKCDVFFSYDFVPLTKFYINV